MPSIAIELTLDSKPQANCLIRNVNESLTMASMTISGLTIVSPW
jgi:hypothetical protein